MSEDKARRHIERLRTLEESTLESLVSLKRRLRKAEAMGED